eukprot:SAG31_NODE_805_length_11970_cov_3.710793_2_plen_1098_part_00
MACALLSYTVAAASAETTWRLQEAPRGSLPAVASAPTSFAISVDQTAVGLGRVVNVTVDTAGFASSPNGTVFWPFVNGSQWGSFATCAVLGRAPAAALGGGECSILLPLPFSGVAEITVAVLQEGRGWGGGINISTPDCRLPAAGCTCDQAKGCVYPVGTPFPAAAQVVSRSGQPAHVTVHHRLIKLPPDAGLSNNAQHDVCMDWEPWHTALNTGRWMGRPGASGMPLVGMYSSFHIGVIRQHAIWLTEAGITCIEIDWSNSLWGHRKWGARSSGAQQLNNATVLALHTYANMRAEGHDTPKALFMVGLRNGPPATPTEVGREAAWIRDNLLSTLGQQHFVTLHGKPLLLVLYCGSSVVPNKTITKAVSAGGSFTVRWMATQLQENPDLGLAHGFWSWMDGSIDPVPTLRPDGSTEALTVTPAFFAGGGWLGPQARGQNRGATLTAEMAQAVKYRPTVLLVCQWNEWAGQPDHKVGGFVDAYNLSYTNDLEPTALSECGGYQHADDSGQLPICDTGWGFFNLNLLAATLQSYRDAIAEVSKPTTVLRISHPPAPATVISKPPLVNEPLLRVTWAVVGPGSSYEVVVDDDLLSTTVVNETSLLLDLSTLEDGVHSVSVGVVGGYSHFPLDRGSLDSAATSLQPQDTIDRVSFTLEKPPKRAETVSSRAVGFVDQPQQTSYEYGSSILLENGTYYNFFCSPGGYAPAGNDGVIAWDVIRMITSRDGRKWSAPTIMLQPSTAWDHTSVCDPSIIKFRGTYFLYHTCINTCVGATQRPPDRYYQNRICVALADNIAGPYRKIGPPVLQDLSCDPGGHNTTCAKEQGAYCVGQPSATIIDGSVVVFYSSVGGVNDDAQPPNPGRILAMSSKDGVHFVPRHKTQQALAPATDGSAPPPKSATLFSQRDVDVRYDRESKQLLMVQGDVGSNQIFWSLSNDGGVSWLPWDANRTISVHNVIGCATCNNHNPGVAALPDGSFGAQTFVLVASSYENPGKWGLWHLFRTDIAVTSAGFGCASCAPSGCDHACSAGGKTMVGRCAFPGSSDPAKCCTCEDFQDDNPCAKCAASAGGCVELCAAIEPHVAGMCMYGDSNPQGLCCECFP